MHQRVSRDIRNSAASMLLDESTHSYLLHRITAGCPADAVTGARNYISRFRVNPTTLQIILSSKLLLLENALATCWSTQLSTRQLTIPLPIVEPYDHRCTIAVRANATRISAAFKLPKTTDVENKHWKVS